MNHYIPTPVSIDDVKVNTELMQLMEKLAKNKHETWVAHCLEEGWVLGPERSAIVRTHPCLRPYEELSNEDKEVDRAAILDLLKTMIKLGYKIEKA